jgi:two-component system sensor histidine kinase KdpD
MLVEEVVRNLLANALHYSRPGTPIDVVASLEETSIRVAVADHGPGVPPEEQDQIFRSFHRLGDAETTTKGYGLGLYFADKLIGALGGAITVESPVWADEGEPGARFTFTLPIAAAEPDDADPDDAEIPVDSKGAD